MELLLIGTDTPHRRFIINKILDAGYNLTSCIFSKSKVKPKFNTSSPWIKLENTELVDLYLSETRGDLDRLKNVLYPDELGLNKPSVKQQIENADFIIISGADLIGGDILEAILNKSMNVHMGISEEYRGLDSNLWAWYHRDYRNIGVSLHKLDRVLDTGNLFQVGYIDMKNDTKVWKLRFYEASLAVKLISQTLNGLKTNNYALKKQIKIGRYYSFMPNELKKCLSITPLSNFID
jgi:methionyl-tRNA formyltransferase